MYNIDLQGRVALVTGAAKREGIGHAVAHALAEAGARVAITDLNFDKTQPENGQDGNGQGEGEADGFTRFACDLADPLAPGRLFNAVSAKLGPVAILVNNAAYSERDGVDALTGALLDAHYAVNVRGMVLLCLEMVRRWQGDKGGRIINLTSGQGAGPMPDELAYATSKGAVEAFTVSFSAAVARQGITVNAVDPGPTDTGWIWPELREELVAKSPRGRIGLPKDAARLIRFLASDEAEWITGEIIRSRGGV